MAPSLVLQPGGISTRSKTSLGGLSLRSNNVAMNPKRKQDNSPPKGSKPSLKRRPALGELTNAAALRSAAIKKGSATDLSNLKPSSRSSSISVHHDNVKPKLSTHSTTSTTTRALTKPSVLANSKVAVTNINVKSTRNSHFNAAKPSLHVNKLPSMLTKPNQPSIKKVVVSKAKKSTTVTKTNASSNSVLAAPQIPPLPPPAAIQKPRPNSNINIKRDSLRSHRRSSGIKSDESSLYVSALEELDLTNSNGSTKSRKSSNLNNKKTSVKATKKGTRSSSVEAKKEKSPIEHFDKEIQIKELAKDKCSIPTDVDDFDKETWDDPLQVSCYAMHIFEYLKSRESEFVIKDYLKLQSSSDKGRINADMRSVLVDWMVEVQETFELNHETLYLAVKLVDLFLSKLHCSRDRLQLLGAVAIFIASKFDDRIPPQLSEVVYICSDTYSIEDLKDMEIRVITTVGFDLGIPLSYRFLRRYARCNKIQLPLLTLARYILELSLMEYSLIFESDSKLACAALYLAQRMKNVTPWNKTLEYYSGYKIQDFKHIVVQLNRLLPMQPRTTMMSTLATVFNKYSHSIFFEVAQTPLVKEHDLFC